MIAPILVGPKARIEAVAKEHGIDIGGLPIVDAPYSEASAEKAVELVREGKAEALMKGSLHTDELMGAVVRKEPLRTKRRMSHCFLMQNTARIRGRSSSPDAAVNIAPTLSEKADIVCNAVELAQAFGIARPRVAILAAVETINPDMPSTLDAACCARWPIADRSPAPSSMGRWLSTTPSPNPRHDQENRLRGRREGDILLVPDLERQHARQTTAVSRRCRAGIVVGAPRADCAYQPR